MRRVRHRPPARRLRSEIEATILPTRDAPRAASSPGAVAFARAPGRLAPGVRVYAVGDVHGCAEPLAALHAAIREDLRLRPTADARVIHLGDYVGVGPDSADVVERLTRADWGGARVVNLLGDHEQMLLDALDGDRPAATDFLHAGGDAALRSWGIDPATPREEWERLLPPAHVGFLRSLGLRHRVGCYLFVHAGIRPGVAIARQSPDDLLRIRHAFLDSQSDHGVVVVHGHTAGAAPVVQPNRIGIDTGAGIGGKLTCAVLEEDRIGFLSADAGAMVPHIEGGER